MKQITISQNELMHHPELFTDLIEYNPVIGGDDVDFLVTCENDDLLAIERKAPSDLLSSIADNRLFNQAIKMSKLTQHCYFVITGSVEECQRGWEWNAIQGALITVQQMGCVVVHCQGESDFIPCIVRLEKRSRDNVKVKPVRQSTIFGNEEGVLMSLPGIGEKTIYGDPDNNIPGLLSRFNGNVALCLTALTAPHNGKTNYINRWGKKSRDNLVAFLGGRLEYYQDDIEVKGK